MFLCRRPAASRQFFESDCRRRNLSNLPKSYKIFLLFICSICSDLWNFCSKSTHFSWSPTVVGVIEFYSLRSSKKSFKFIQIFQFLFVRFFRFVRYLPDRALHIPETKRIRKPPGHLSMSRRIFFLSLRGSVAYGFISLNISSRDNDPI